MAAIYTPEMIQPMRFALNEAALNETLKNEALRSDRRCFSWLVFPWQKALNQFNAQLKTAWKDVYGNDKVNYPSYRQLNNAILALAPAVIHGFEYEMANDYQPRYRMLAFSRPCLDERGRIIRYDVAPTVDQLRGLVKCWLALWGESPKVQPLITGMLKLAWDELLAVLDGAECDWQHNISYCETDTLTYATVPALLAARLQNREQTIKGAKIPYTIQWRRVNDGSKNGLYLVSQPLEKNGYYFAYSLTFSRQTQAYISTDGTPQPQAWIFAKLGIQRYITGAFKRDSYSKRNLNVLVGYNREQFEVDSSQFWQPDTTLLEVGVRNPWSDESCRWDDGVNDLLKRYRLRVLQDPRDILAAPAKFGRYTDAAFTAADEYYPIFAEGRKFVSPDGRSAGHQVDVGLSNTEYDEVIRGVMEHLGDWLTPSEPFVIDRYFPKRGMVSPSLHTHKYIKETNAKTSAYLASIQTLADDALWRPVAHGGKSRLHVVVLYRDKGVCNEMMRLLQDVMTVGNTNKHQNYHVPPFVTITPMLADASLHEPLDSGGLSVDVKRTTAWAKQMTASYREKREEWREFLQAIPWEPDAYRMIMIDSRGFAGADESQAIKGAVRDACAREGIASQFLLGDRVAESITKRAAADPNQKPRIGAPSSGLSGEAEGSLKNAALDLMLRQSGLLYGEPRVMYTKQAHLPVDIAEQLDVIAFCRIKKNNTAIHYALAVRLSACGAVDVMLPGESMRWMPYLEVIQALGILFSESRSHLRNAGRKGKNPLELTNAQLSGFAHNVLTQHLRRPTVAVIEGEVWRNKGCWDQLKNDELAKRADVLDFGKIGVYQRDSEAVSNLLGVVRLRMDNETPQYITLHEADAEEGATDATEDEYIAGADLRDLTSYVEMTPNGLLHYFSIAKLTELQDDQKHEAVWSSYRLDEKVEKSHEMAIKHAQIVEMVPFFLHPSLQTASGNVTNARDEGGRQLCRVLHFLRVAPNVPKSNVLVPYPMYLGDALLQDQLCIVDEE